MNKLSTSLGAADAHLRYTVYAGNVTSGGPLQGAYPGRLWLWVSGGFRVAFPKFWSDELVASCWLQTLRYQRGQVDRPAIAVPFTYTMTGWGLSDVDRIRIVDSTTICGQSGAETQLGLPSASCAGSLTIDVVCESLCNTMYDYITLYYFILYYFILYYITLYYIIYFILNFIILYYIILYYIILYYNIILYTYIYTVYMIYACDINIRVLSCTHYVHIIFLCPSNSIKRVIVDFLWNQLTLSTFHIHVPLIWP